VIKIIIRITCGIEFCFVSVYIKGITVVYFQIYRRASVNVTSFIYIGDVVIFIFLLIDVKNI